jgi:hypothetical protein
MVKQLLGAALASVLSALPDIPMTEIKLRPADPDVDFPILEREKPRRRKGKHHGGGVSKFKTGKLYGKEPNTYTFAPNEAEVRLATIYAIRVRRWLRANPQAMQSHGGMDVKLVPGHIQHKMRFVTEIGQRINSEKKETTNVEA